MTSCPTGASSRRRASTAGSSSSAARRAFGLEAAQILLGHTKPDVTQLYAERDMNQAPTVTPELPIIGDMGSTSRPQRAERGTDTDGNGPRRKKGK